jgi:DNA-binding LytR/AlgR family response regulator
MEEVIYFRAEEKYTTVVTRDKSYLIRTPINELEQLLDQTLFWRIHRGVIVNVRQIHHVQKGLNGTRIITLKDRTDTLTSSRSYRHLFEQM